MRQAIFMDRDGVINKDEGYSPKLELYEDIPEFFKLVKKLNLPVFTISNQSAIGLGKTTHEEVENFNNWLSILVGYPIKAYYCPHKKTDKCACRKPEPGLIYKAAIENDINIGESFFIGDKVSDIEAARDAGMFNYLVKRDQNFSPSSRAYFNACNIQIYTLKEIGEIIEEWVCLQRGNCS